MPLSRKVTPGRGGFHDPFDIFREVFGGGGAAGIFETFFGGGVAGRSRKSTARLRFALRHADHARGSGLRRGKRDRNSKIRHLRKCHGSGAEAGSRAINCPACGGRGQVISSRGFFQVSQTCPRCRGAGQIIEKPCRACDGEGRVERPSRIKLKVPAGIAKVRVCVPRGNGEAGIRGGRIGRSLCRHAREGARNFSARRRQSLLRSADSVHRRRARRRSRRCPRSKAKPTSKSPPERRAVRFSSCAAKGSSTSTAAAAAISSRA